MQHRDMLFRYANRHDFIVRPSDCTPRVILPFPYLPPAAPTVSYFFVICTPNRAELLQRYTATTTASVAAAVAAAENLK